MHGEGGVHAGKARYEVVLESADCVFCFVDAMEVGGTSWNSMLEDWKWRFSAPGHSLSRIWVCGVNTRSVRYVCSFIIAFTMSRSDRDFNGSARIALASSMNITMMYLLPLLDVIGKRPVWSEKTFPSNSIILNVTNLFARTGSVGGSVVMTELVVGLGGGVGFVERRFCRICRRWHLTVASDFGRWLRTRSAVRPGQVV